METQYVPAMLADDSEGNTYARVAPTSFPRRPNGDSVVVHQVTSYAPEALWDSVEAWFDGKEPASGKIDPKAASIHRFPGHGGATWKIYKQGTQREDKIRLDWKSFANPQALDPHTFGYRWTDDFVKHTDSKDGPLVTLPE